MNLEKQWDFSKENDQKKFDKLPDKEKQKVVNESHMEANILKGRVELGEVSCYESACDEFEQEFIKKTKEELSKEKIPAKIDLKETLKNLKPTYAYGRDENKPYRNKKLTEHSKKRNDGDYLSRNFSGYNSLGEYNKLKIAMVDYEIDHSSNVKYKLENYFILCHNSMEIYETLVSKEPHLNNLGYKLPKASRKKGEISEMMKIYSKLLNDEAILVIGEPSSQEFIMEEMEAGKDILEVLKDAERRGLFEIINIPAYYTDGAAMEEREKKINDNIQMARDDIKSYIKKELAREIREKLWVKEKEEERQEDLKMRREDVEKRYGEYLKKHSENLDPKLVEQIKESLVKHNNTDSHSAAYREYEMTNGLHVKDRTAVFIIEESSLAMKPSSAGWGGEVINIKLAMVDDNGEKILANFGIKDRFGDRKDQLGKWYSSVEIENIDEEKKEITVKLSKKGSSEVDTETFSFK